MVITNSMQKIRSALYRNRDKVSKNAIIDIHGLRTNDENANEVNYEKIISIIDKCHRHKDLHLVINSGVRKAKKVVIKIDNI